MQKCDPKAIARCPYKRQCGDNPYFSDGSGCDKFNQRICNEPPTNADRIRGMSDEELAELLCTADWCESCDQTRDNGTCRAMELDGRLCKHCVAAGLRWLRRPAEEELT